MKIFDKFMINDKRGELIIRYFDKSMTSGTATLVFPLKRVRNGEVTYKSIEKDLVGLNEFSKIKIKDAFELLRTPAKGLKLVGVEKS